MDETFSQLSQIKPGGHDLRREVIVHHQRERIINAAVELIAERGYRSVSVAAIVKHAATARLKFYENFASKEACFLAAYDAALEDASGRVAAACEGAGDSSAERAVAGVDALLGFVSERPALTRACLLEAPSLGAAMGDRRERALSAFAPLLTGAREAAGEQAPPERVEETIFEGLYWLLYDAILTGQPEQIEDLRPALIEFLLLPFLGAAAAHQATLP